MWRPLVMSGVTRVNLRAERRVGFGRRRLVIICPGDGVPGLHSQAFAPAP
jgi:hypothetical protein